jgi:hypothetical protein
MPPRTECQCHEQNAKSERRQIPKCAKSRTARNPEEREIPNSAKSRTATKSGTAPFGAVWDFALFGIWRRLGFRALWDFALFGIQRRYCSAPFGA